MPGVSRAISTTTTLPTTSDAQSVFSNNSPRNTLSPTSGVVVAYQDPKTPGPGSVQEQGPVPTGLPFDEEAKLVFGVVSSLRNMIKKLSGREESFVSYRTSTYRLHLFETLSGYKFIMFSDPNTDSMRFVLRQIYAGPFIEYVVRNPLMTMDSKEAGIDNEHFRNATDRLMRGLSVFN